MKSKQFCIFMTIFSAFFIFSMYYQSYSKQRQLFHIHKIKQGTLKMAGQFIKQYKSVVEQINLMVMCPLCQFSIEIQQKQAATDAQISKFILGSRGMRAIYSEKQNFVSILKSKGQVNSFGDSFYKIKDQNQILCIDQVISSITIINNGFILFGDFSDCQHSQYSISVDFSQFHSIKLIPQIILSTIQYNRILINFHHVQSNKYFGLGQQFSHLNLGHNRPFSVFVRQKGVGRSDQPETTIINWYKNWAGGSYFASYSPMPIWLSINMQNIKNNHDSQTDKNFKALPMGFILNSDSYFVWINNKILVWDSKVEIQIYFGQSVKDVVKKIAEVNGYTPPVPDWVNEGAIVGLQGGTEQVMKKYEILKNSGSKISGLWLQDWVSKRKSLGFSRLWWNWELDKNHYRFWHEMRNQLQKQNVSLLIYLNPMLTKVQGKKQNYTKNFYGIAKQEGYFIKDKTGKDFETSAFSDWTACLIDFNNKKAKKFYQSIIRQAVKQTGARGMMIDFGEAYPLQNQSKDLQNSIRLHNRYPTEYHKAARQVLDQFQQRQMYTFSRAGYLHSPKYTLSLWAGDQSMNFKKNSGLPSCLTAMLSSSLVGYSNTHCDIGGYSSFQLPFSKTSVRTQILMIRWLQLGAFSPVFRSHQGNNPDGSIQFYSSQQMSTQFSFYSQIFNALAEYRKKQAAKSAEQKLPLVRPMFLLHPQNPTAYQIKDQYYLGQNMLVCPILSNKNKRKLYLPMTGSGGDWINIWTKKAYSGCDCYYDSLQFMPPVFIKENSDLASSIIAQVQRIVRNFENNSNFNKYNDKHDSKSNKIQL